MRAGVGRKESRGGVRVRPRGCLVGGLGCCRARATRGEAGAALLGPGVVVGCCWALRTAAERAGGRRETSGGGGQVVVEV